MFWETLWALVLGFALSGAVQAFVTRGQMERALGGREPGTLARASFLGMVSSSCSYAATAMAKSLFAKGADLTAALVFMIASTNLVVELGIVLALLIGWQFTASEFAGGLLMIALFGAGVALPPTRASGRGRPRRASAALRARPPQLGEATPAARAPATTWRVAPRRAADPHPGWLDGCGGLRHRRHHHAAPRDAHRVYRRRVARRARARCAVGAHLHQRTRLRVVGRERAGGPAHRHPQLRVLHRQRAHWRRRCGRAASASAGSSHSSSPT